MLFQYFTFVCLHPVPSAHSCVVCSLANCKHKYVFSFIHHHWYFQATKRAFLALRVSMQLRETSIRLLLEADSVHGERCTAGRLPGG